MSAEAVHARDQHPATGPGGAKLGEDWSPRQIAAWPVRTLPDRRETWVSLGTIYLTLFVQARDAPKRERATQSPNQPFGHLHLGLERNGTIDRFCPWVIPRARARDGRPQPRRWFRE